MKFDNSKLQLGQRMLILRSHSGWLNKQARQQFFTGEIIHLTKYSVKFQLYDYETGAPVVSNAIDKDIISVPYHKTRRLIKPMTGRTGQYVVFDDMADYEQEMANYTALVHQDNDEKFNMYVSNIQSQFKDIALDKQQTILRKLMELDNDLKSYHKSLAKQETEDDN